MVYVKMNPRIRRGYGGNILIWCMIIALALSGCGKTETETGLKTLPNLTTVKQPITVTAIDLSKQPYLGDPNAPVKVVEFADFKCPACKNWKDKYMDSFKRDFVDTGMVQLYFVNFAFIDRDSYQAAAAGEAIYRQLGNEGFWQFYNQLYASQGKETDIWATKSFLLDFVEKNMSGVNVAQFKDDLANDTYLFDVKEDYKLAGALGVNGTPKFMVNGRLLPNSSYEGLITAINADTVGDGK